MYSCSGSECKELLARLGWREVAQALNDPALVITLAKFRQRVPQFFDILEHPDQQREGAVSNGFIVAHVGRICNPSVNRTGRARQFNYFATQMTTLGTVQNQRVITGA